MLNWLSDLESFVYTKQLNVYESHQNPQQRLSTKKTAFDSINLSLTL